MATNNSWVPALIAGAVAGGLVTWFMWQSPAGQEALLGQQRSPILEQDGEAIHTDPALAARAWEQTIIQTVDEAQKAVVSIVITKDVPVFERYFEQRPFGPFGDLFGEFQIPRLRERGTQEQEIGGGSGFLVSADGLVVTNRHVVDDPEASYTVFLNDGTKYEAEVVARDTINDVAVLRIQGDNLPFLAFTDSDELMVGQTAIAIGNALGEFRNSVSTGIISGLSRSIQAGDGLGQSEQLDEVIQTDAAINPGNSGGPLLNLEGEVVGVNVAVALGSENIGFALPANLVREIVESVRETGKIVRPYLGVRYMPITPQIQETNNLPYDYGALVVRGESPDQLAVIPGSPAGQAGIREGDIILEIDGQRLDEETSLAEVIREKEVGDQVQLKIWSQGEERTVTATLAEAP